MKSNFVVLAGLFFILFSKSHGGPLNVLNVDVDHNPVREGQSVCLKCMNNLKKKEKLTDLVWFHGTTPIFHNSIFEGMPMRSFFTSKRYKIDESRTNLSTLQLKDMSLSAAGSYSCQVYTGNQESQKATAECDVKVVSRSSPSASLKNRATTPKSLKLKPISPKRKSKKH